VGGTCYASGENTPTEVCVAGAQVACGATGDACCQNNTCAGGCCVDGTCRANAATCGPTLGACNGGTGGCATGPCGGNGQNCCVGNPGGVGTAANFCTGSGLACIPGTVPNKCGTCGGTGQPCCDGNICTGGGCCDNSAKKCIANGSACTAPEGTCTNGGCLGGTCGEVGQACCGAVGCTTEFMSCQAATCAPCGGLGEACCVGFTGGDEFCGEPYVCDKATLKCAACGASGQDCCAGALCPNDGANLCNAATGKCP